MLRIVRYFGLFMFSAFVLFNVSVFLAEPATDILERVNRRGPYLSLQENIGLVVGTIFATGLWCALWIWFKFLEKKCLELIFAKSES